MWSSTNQRIKALMAARNREKERLNRPIHVLRADVVLRVQNESGEVILRGRALLNDFSVNGITLYANSALSPNVDLVLEIDRPRAFSILGRVVWSQYQSSHSHVITTETFPYRVGIAFKFKSAEEETAFVKFCEEMAAAYCEKGHLKVLGDITQTSSDSITGSFTPEEFTAVVQNPAAQDPAPQDPAVSTASVENPAAATATPGDAVASAPAEETPAAPQESVTDVLSQLGVQLPGDEEKKAA